MSQPGNLKGATPERLVTLKPSIPSVRIESAAVVLLYRVKMQDSHERDATTQLSANHGEITRKRQKSQLPLNMPNFPKTYNPEPQKISIRFWGPLYYKCTKEHPK